MADLSITTTNISAGTPSTVGGIAVVVGNANAAAFINMGKSIYISSTDQNAYLADADASSTAAAANGIAMCAANTGQPLTYIKSGPLNMGGILTRGLYYVQSTNAGGIAPMADLTTGAYSTVLGYAYSTTTMIVGLGNGVGPVATGVSV